MTAAFHIRAGQPADAARLAVLATQVWLHTYATEGISDDIAHYVGAELTPDEYAATLDDPDSHVLVAEQGAHLVGFAVLQFGLPCPADGQSTAELQTLYVQEHFTGRGVGHALLQAAQAKARGRAACALWLTVNAQNARAIAFYARQGYEKIGTTHFVLGHGHHENHVLIGPRA